MAYTTDQIVQMMLAEGKGVLAIDESHGTCEKRFTALGVDCTEETRQDYREMLITAPDIEQYLGGMILFDETLRQSTKDGRRFVDVLMERGIMPGIKVDMGTVPLALNPGELVTQGLDGLRERLDEYANLGATFTKWRAVIAIDSENALPSPACVIANAHALARYAALVEEAGMVPMVEPEILINGTHDLEECAQVTSIVLEYLFDEMMEQGVTMDTTVLKTSMVITGDAAETQATPEEVADRTVEVLVSAVPHDLSGVVFLSGGQTPDQAAEHLNLMNARHGGSLPWPLSFSYGRGLQQPALESWAKHPADKAAAQALLAERCRLASLASMGKMDG